MPYNVDRQDLLYFKYLAQANFDSFLHLLIFTITI
jgi:hypothetical protein